MDKIDVTLAQDELDAIRLITVKKAFAEDNMKRIEFPKEMEQNVIAAFYTAAGTALAEAKFAESKWWASMVKKYNLPPDVSFESNQGFFFTGKQQ